MPNVNRHQLAHNADLTVVAEVCAVARRRLVLQNASLPSCANASHVITL
jgi:hypothetical protein